MRQSDQRRSAERRVMTAPTRRERSDTSSPCSGGRGVNPYRQTPGACGGLEIRSHASIIRAAAARGANDAHGDRRSRDAADCHVTVPCFALGESTARRCHRSVGYATHANASCVGRRRYEGVLAARPTRDGASRPIRGTAFGTTDPRAFGARLHRTYAARERNRRRPPDTSECDGRGPRDAAWLGRRRRGNCGGPRPHGAYLCNGSWKRWRATGSNWREPPLCLREGRNCRRNSPADEPTGCPPSSGRRGHGEANLERTFWSPRQAWL
ncbi:hypothetical protein SCALM49S_05642 [Streptomyces californicus]